MTTFTLQDLTPAQQEAVKQHEAMHAAHQVLNTRSINDLPTTPEEDEAMDALAKLGGGVALNEMFAGMGQDLTGKVPVLNISDGGRTVQYQTAPNAPTPQPSGENPHNIGDIINTICTQLQLLATVISQSKAQPEGAQESLQETVALVLQQSDWFKDMVKDEVGKYDFDSYAESAVESVVEKEIEHYFDARFDPTDHFDFNDAVQDAVSDQIDDVVSDKIDEAVDSYLSGATISISK